MAIAASRVVSEKACRIAVSFFEATPSTKYGFRGEQERAGG
jgi:hypothetical protein